MIRIRRLQRKGSDGVWHSDAYAIETHDGQITFRYSLAWEYLGGRYNRMLQEQAVPLERLEEVLVGDSVRWLPAEVFETDKDEEIIQALDRECHVPRPATASAGQRTDQHSSTGLITLQAHVVSGRLQLKAPLTSPIRVRGDHIYLEDGRQLQIALASDPMPEAQPG
jgi:hypothetical protein